MKSTCALFVLFGALASVGSAAPCLGTQPLSGLIASAGTGCTLGDKLFTNFSLNQSGPLAFINPAVINVVTSTRPDGDEVLQFTGGLTATGGVTGGTLEFIIGYTVRTVTGVAMIEDLTLSVGALTQSGLGPNSATVTERACIGVNVNCNSGNAIITLTATPNDAPQYIVFQQVSALSVTKQVRITAAAFNTVTLNSVTNEVSQLLTIVDAQVPEPSSYALLCSGLGVLAFARKYRR
jgi:hypothetical protein